MVPPWIYISFTIHTSPNVTDQSGFIFIISNIAYKDNFCPYQVIRAKRRHLTKALNSQVEREGFCEPFVHSYPHFIDKKFETQSSLTSQEVAELGLCLRFEDF